MMRTALALLLATALACAGAARQRLDLPSLDGGVPGSSHQGLLNLMRDVERRKEGGERPRIIVRFIVPPGAGDKFEDAWLDLEKEVMKCEHGVEVYDLKKHTLDNRIYLSYGEWKDMRGLHEYFVARHFKKFVDYIEDHGVKFEVEFLKSMSSDLDQEQQGLLDKRHSRRNELSDAVLASLPNNGLDADETTVLNVWKDVHRSRNMHHVLISYNVPPGEGEGFTDAWLDAAEETVKEKHNRMYSLAKVATDNTRFYAYGTWDSLRDYMDHFESKHVGKLIDYTADRDIVWFINPLTKIGHQPE